MVHCTCHAHLGAAAAAFGRRAATRAQARPRASASSPGPDIHTPNTTPTPGLGLHTSPQAGPRTPGRARPRCLASRRGPRRPRGPAPYTSQAGALFGRECPKRRLSQVDMPLARSLAPRSTDKQRGRPSSRPPPGFRRDPSRALRDACSNGAPSETRSCQMGSRVQSDKRTELDRVAKTGQGGRPFQSLAADAGFGPASP